MDEDEKTSGQGRKTTVDDFYKFIEQELREGRLVGCGPADEFTFCWDCPCYSECGPDFDPKKARRNSEP
jgi:hypothetical protein